MKPSYALPTLCLCLLVASAWAADEKTLPTVTVTGSYDSVDDRRSSNSQKTVVGSKEIEQLGGLNIGEVMAKLPGIDGGSGTMALRARGMMRDSVQILVDGERLASNSRLTMNLIERLPSSELERVEINRGSSAEFGGGAPVTVNLVMRRAVPKESTSLKLALGSREGEPHGQINVSQGGGEGGFSWLLPLTYFLHGSVTEKDSVRQDFTSGTRTLWQVDHEAGSSPAPGISLAPKFTWKHATDSFSLWPSVVVSGGERRNEMTRYSYADPAAGTGYAPDGSRTDLDDTLYRLFRLRAEGEKNFGDTKLSPRLSYSQGRRDSDTEHVSRDATGPITTSTEALSNLDHELSGALRADHVLEEHLLAGGLEFTNHRRRDQQTLAATTTVYRAEAWEWTAWLQDEWNLAKGLVLTGGVRGEAMQLSVDGVERDYSRLSPSVALRWEPGKEWVVRTSLGAGLKIPKLDELTDLAVTSLNANSPLEADRRGNPDLLPERSLNFEAVLEHYLADKAGVLGANFYWRATENFVERRIELEGTRWVDRPRNEGDAVHYGFELDGKLKTDGWGLQGGTLRGHFTLPRSEVKDARLGVTRIARETPTYQLTLGHDQSLPAWKASAGFLLQFYGRVKSDVPGEQWASSEARAMLDLYALRKLTPNLNLRLNLQNVLGTDSRKHEAAWDGTDSYLLDGDSLGMRSVMLSLEGKW